MKDHVVAVLAVFSFLAGVCFGIGAGGYRPSKELVELKKEAQDRGYATIVLDEHGEYVLKWRDGVKGEKP